MYTERMMSSLVRRRCAVAQALAGCLLGAMTFQLGPTTTSQAVDRMNSMSMRPLPSTPPRPVVREPLVWVPDRVVPMPGEGVVVVPGHWERPLDSHEVHVPSLTVRNPETGVSTTLPAGVRPPSDERIGP